jgi:hypothetical protein
MLSRKQLSGCLTLATLILITCQILVTFALSISEGEAKEFIGVLWHIVANTSILFVVLSVLQFIERAFYENKQFRAKKKILKGLRAETLHMESCHYHLPNQHFLKCAVNPSEKCLNCSSYQPKNS